MDEKLEYELTAEEFLAASDLVIEKVETHELKPGSFVWVKSLTAAERGNIDADAARFRESKGKDSGFVKDFSIMLAFRCVCNAKGERFFTDIKQVEQLKKKNAAVIARIAEVAAKLSGLSKNDVKDLEKNLPEIQPDDSPSA